MSHLHIDKKFWRQWVIVNTVCLPVSLVLFKAFTYSLVAIKPPLEDNVRFSIQNASFAMVGVLVGLAQWLILRKKVSRISSLWILTNILGLYVATVVSYVLTWYSASFSFHQGLLSVYLIQFALAVFIGAVGGVMGGFITGIPQGLLLARRIVLTRLWIIWTIINTGAWAFSWSLGWAFGFFLSYEVSKNFEPLLSEEMFFSSFALLLGTISGFLNAVITGKVLVWALRQFRIYNKIGSPE